MAKKPRAPADPLAVALPSASKGTTEEPIPVEEAPDVECFKCGRLGHYQSKCKPPPSMCSARKKGTRPLTVRRGAGSFTFKSWEVPNLGKDFSA